MENEVFQWTFFQRSASLPSLQVFLWKWIYLIWGLMCWALLFSFQFSFSVQEETHSCTVMPHWIEPSLEIIISSEMKTAWYGRSYWNGNLRKTQTQAKSIFTNDTFSQVSGDYSFIHELLYIYICIYIYSIWSICMHARVPVMCKHKHAHPMDVCKPIHT